MGLEPFDSSSDDTLEAFGSEMALTPTQDPEPAFLRTPTMRDSTALAEAQYSVLTTDRGQPQTSRAWLVAAVSVVFGVTAGFAAGYAVTHRGMIPIDVFTFVRESSGNSPAQPSAQPTRNPDHVVAPASPDASIASVPATPSPATPELRTSVAPSTSSGSSRTNHLSATRQQAAVLTQPASQTGSIEVQSHPEGARVLLDGTVIGQAPLSIPGIGEGTHEIRLELAGFSPWVASVRVKGGSRARVGASLEP